MSLNFFTNIKFLSRTITLIFLISKVISDSLPTCQESDFKKIFLPCDSNNQRSIISTRINECTLDLNSNKFLPSQIVNVTCSTTCDKGYMINMSDNKASCLKCPPNTFSTGGDLIINGIHEQWSKNILSTKGFQSSCLIAQVGSREFEENYCTGFTVKEDNTLIKSGHAELSGVNYIGTLIYGFNLKRKGEVKFKYKKDTIDEYFSKNGEFVLFVDYDVILQDKDLNSGWKDFQLDLEVGDHNMIFVYEHYVNPFNSETENLELKIEYLEITGLEYFAQECSACVNGVSPEGSSECFHCNANFYYDKDQSKCEACSENKYSFANSIGENSCLERPHCKEDDFEVVDISTCGNGNENEDGIKNGDRRITYNITENALCDYNHKEGDKSFTKEETDSTCLPLNGFTNNNTNTSTQLVDNTFSIQCPYGQFSNADTNYKCLDCSDGNYATNIYQINKFYNATLTQSEFNNTCTSINTKFCEQKKWEFKYDKITVGKYFPIQTGVHFELSKYIKVDTGFNFAAFTAKITFYLVINKLTENEFLEIKLNDMSLFNYTKIKEDKENSYKENIVINLQEGDNLIKWIYYRNKESVTNSVSPVYIQNITITDSVEGSAAMCSACPSGTFRTNTSNTKCIKCGKGLTSNTDRTACEKCPSEKYSNNLSQCVDCPLFTNSSNNKCKLSSTIIKDSHKLRFNLTPLKNMIERNCNGQILCYNNKFIGPIKNKIKNSNAKNHYNEMFFVSVFESDRISITDFSYEAVNLNPSSSSDSDKLEGHIFGLFDKELTVNHTGTSYFKTCKENEDIKLLKNLGGRINKVSLVDLNVDMNSNGVMIEYKEGDVCLKDPTRKYRSFLFLQCKRDLGLKSPAFVSKIQNECTYLFKWSTDFACRSCLKDELTPNLTPCRNNKQTVMYEDQPYCLIFNITNTDKFHMNEIEIESDVMFDTNSVIMKEYMKFKTRVLEQDTGSKGETATARDTTYISPFLSPYIEINSEEKECSIIQIIDKETFIIILCIPVVYFITVFLFLCIYCRYKKLRSDYEKLNVKDSNTSQIEEKNDRQIDI